MKKTAVLGYWVLLLLSGCASYQLSGTKSQVVVDKMSPDTITVSFCGSAYMDAEQVKKYALQRASLEALSRTDCANFVVVRRSDNSRICAIGYEARAGAEPPENATLAVRSEDSVPRDYPDYVEPNLTLTVRCLKQGEPVPADAVNAEGFLRENFPGLKR